MQNEPRAGERDLAQRLSRIAAAGEAIPEADLSELAELQRVLLGTGAGAADALRATARSWRANLAAAGQHEAAREVSALLQERLAACVDAWRADLPSEGEDGPQPWFEALAEVTRLEAETEVGADTMAGEAAGEAAGAAAAAGDLARDLAQDRARLRAGLAAAVGRHPPDAARRRAFADALVDAAAEVLTVVDDLPPDRSARRLDRLADDLAWHLEAVEVDDSEERRRLARRHRRLVAERQERLLEARLEGLFGARTVGWWERGVLLAILAVLALMLVPGVASLTPREQLILLWVDSGLCFFFLWDFLVKLSLVGGSWSWMRRHLITDLLPALPFPLLLIAVQGTGAAVGAGVGAQKGRTVLLLRLLRLPRLARYLRVLLPFLRAARAVGFLLRGLDRLVRQHGGLLDRDVILYPTPEERRRARHSDHLRAREGAQRWQLRASVDRLWRATLEAADHPTGSRLARARLAALTEAARAIPPGAGAAPAAEHAELCAEDLLGELSGVTDEEVEGRLGGDAVSRIARAARSIARSPLRWLPIFRAYVPRVGDEDDDATVTARVVRGAAQRGLGHLRRLWWVADLHGTLTPSDLVGQVGATLVKRTLRPAVRLLLLGGAYLALVLLAGLFGLDLGDWAKRIGDLVGTTLLVLGSLCFLALGLGFWLQRLASDASTHYAQVASAQFLHMTESVKVRHLPRDAELFAERVFRPERELHGADEEQMRRDRGVFLQGVREWLTEGVPVERSSEGFDPVARCVLLYRDVLDGALLVESDTRATGQLLGNLALKRIRERSQRMTSRYIKGLERLDLERRRTLIGGPYMWFSFISRAITQQTARLIIDYNDNAIPLAELTHAAPATQERYRAWLRSRSAHPEDLVTEGKTGRRIPITTAFTALHFLDDAPERDGAVEKRFGQEVVELLCRDRRALFRRIFGTYPLHLRPQEERVLNLRDVYRRWVEGGRVLILPLKLAALAARQAARGLGAVGRAVKQIRDPRLAYASEDSAESDFYTAARKIDRMRGPGAEACLWQRALVDLEYLGVPLPRRAALGFVGSSVEADLDFLAASSALRERLQDERRRAAADARRLAALVARGLIERAGSAIGGAFDPGPEHLRAAALAYRADYSGLRRLLSAESLPKEVFAAAARETPLPPRVLPRPRLSRAFRRFWAEHGVTDRRARLRARRAALHDVDGVADALLTWARLGSQAARAEGEAQLTEILRHPGQITEQLVTLRAVQTLSLIDVRNYRSHVWLLGCYAQDGDEPARAFRIGEDGRTEQGTRHGRAQAVPAAD